MNNSRADLRPSFAKVRCEGIDLNHERVDRCGQISSLELQRTLDAKTAASGLKKPDSTHTEGHRVSFEQTVEIPLLAAEAHDNDGVLVELWISTLRAC